MQSKSEIIENKYGPSDTKMDSTDYYYRKWMTKIMEKNSKQKLLQNVVTCLKATAIPIMRQNPSSSLGNNFWNGWRIYWRYKSFFIRILDITIC